MQIYRLFVIIATKQYDGVNKLNAKEVSNNIIMHTNESRIKKAVGIKKPTIKDVARAASVSTATVVRALHGSERIRDTTKERVMRVVEELGYQTNDVASALQNNRTYNILTVYHTVPEHFTENFTRGFRAAAENLKSRGLMLTAFRTPSLDPQCAAEALKEVDLSQVDALLIDCGGAELNEFIAQASSMGIPVATFGSDSQSSERIFYVGEDPYVSGKLAGELAGKLLRGHGTMLAFQGPNKVDALNARVQGMRDVIHSDYPEVEILPSVEHSDDDVSSIRGAINILNRSELPSCVFCNSAGGTLALHRAIQYLDLEDKELPLIIGYDFSEDIANMLQDGYCSVTLYQNPYQQAYNALTYMFEYIAKGIRPEKERIIVPCDFIFKHNAHFYLP